MEAEAMQPSPESVEQDAVQVQETATAACFNAFVFPQQASAIYTVVQEYTDPTYSASCPNTNFLKGVKWSPDGACLLTASDDNWMRIYDLPQTVLEAPSISSEPADLACQPDTLQAALRMQEGETVYDFCWYPRMTVTDATSCCCVASSRGHPIHLWDVCNGEIRCSYRGYNEADEVTPAYSIAMTPDGSQLLGGYNRCMMLFDVSRPGRQVRKVATYKKKQDSLPGIVSCLAFSQDASMLAAGSYLGSIALYDARSLDLLYLLHGHKGGLTQVAFSADGNFLLTGARQDPEMLCWDVRYTSDVVYRMQRDTGSTNQRIQFDVEPCGRHLATGGCDGNIKVFDLQTGTLVDEFPVASDTVNGVCFHPFLDLLASSSGERQYQAVGDSDEEGSIQGPPPLSSSATHLSDNKQLRNSLAVWRLQQEPLYTASETLQISTGAAVEMVAATVVSVCS